MDKKVGKNIWYASLGNILPAIFAYLFLFIAARIVGPGTIGLVAVISSFVIIVTALSNVNAQIGLRRYLGMFYSSGELEKFNHFFISTILIVTTGAIISSLLISVPQLRILEIMGISYQYVWIVVSMIFATAFNLVLFEVLVSSLNSKKLILPAIMGALVRFPLFFGFVFLLKSPSFGIVIAYASMLYISTAFYAIYVIGILKGTQRKGDQKHGSSIKQILAGSWVSWIPQIVSQLGAQLGTLLVFAVKGSAEAGLYYIPLTFSSFTLFISTGIQRISQPLIAGMSTEEEQAKFLTHVLKLGYITTIPISIPFLFFGHGYLELFGKNFDSGAGILSILIVAVPMDLFNGIVYHVVYGKGDYRYIFYFGIVGNIPRMTLYFILVPIFGGIGAAFAYLAGSITNTLYSTTMVKKHEFILEYKKYLIITSITVCIGAILWLLQINFIISTIIIITGSFVAYAKLHLFTVDDLHNILFAGIPKKMAEKIYQPAKYIMKKIN